MKKFTLLFLIALVTLNFCVKAQIQQGNVLIGGNIANLSLGLNKPTTFSADITPKAAWFIVDNLALGAYGELGLQTQSGEGTTVTYSIGGLGRYYTGTDVNVLKHGRIFGEATVGIGGVNLRQNGGSTNGFDFSVGPGFAYFVTPSLGLETLLKYNGVVGFGNTTYQHNLGLSFGFQIYLPGKETANKVKGDVK
ncbi:MAG: hypothetical protein JWQ63_1801 [Mucilaginibacter sp.]|jgi:hypothetical protein|nr:hypothetical protein [Mucilaginibacter sp.]